MCLCITSEVVWVPIPAALPVRCYQPSHSYATHVFLEMYRKTSSNKTSDGLRIDIQNTRDLPVDQAPKAAAELLNMERDNGTVDDECARPARRSISLLSRK